MPLCVLTDFKCEMKEIKCVEIMVKPAAISPRQVYALPFIFDISFVNSPACF